MAKYRAKADLYVNDVLIKSGTEFESDNVPGRNWIPIDIGARAKVNATFPSASKADADAMALEAAPDEPKTPEKKTAGGKKSEK